MPRIYSTECKTSKYCGVSKLSAEHGKASEIRRNSHLCWKASIFVNNHGIVKQFATEREAAIQYDKWVLEYQLDRPLNILKPKLAA